MKFRFCSSAAARTQITSCNSVNLSHTDETGIFSTDTCILHKPEVNRDHYTHDAVRERRSMGCNDFANENKYASIHFDEA